MPSLSTCCHSAVCCSASWASCLRRSSSSVSRPRACGSLNADSSESTAIARCSAAARISPTTWSRTRSFSRRQHLLGQELHDRREVRLLVEFLVVELDGVAAQHATTRGSSAWRCRRGAGARCWRRRSAASAGRGRSWSRRSTATGQISRACRMNVISGSVNSWLVSLTISIASASGSRPSVADRCGWPCPPTPGVSTNARPPLSSGLGAVTSTRSTSRPPACGARRRSLRRSAGGISTRSGSSPSGRRHHQPRRGLLAVGHHGGQHGRLVVTDPGHRHVEQRVEQLALALLELTGDHHPDLRVADAPLGPAPAARPDRRARWCRRSCWCGR